MRLRLVCLIAALVLSYSLEATPTYAVILASDHFTTKAGGTGWKAQGWGPAEGGNGFITFTEPPFYGWRSVRNLAAPLDPTTYDKIYIAIDYASPSGFGTSWSGVSFYEGTDNAGDETLFMGDPDVSGNPNYGVDLKTAGGVLDSGVAVNGIMHSMIVEVDVNAGPANDNFRFWFDAKRLDAPTAAVYGISSPIDAAWQSVWLKAAPGSSGVLDFLIIATTPEEVGLVTPEPASAAMAVSAICAVAIGRRRTQCNASTRLGGG